MNSLQMNQKFESASFYPKEMNVTGKNTNITLNASGIPTIPSSTVPISENINTSDFDAQKSFTQFRSSHDLQYKIKNNFSPFHLQNHNQEFNFAEFMNNIKKKANYPNSSDVPDILPIYKPIDSFHSINGLSVNMPMAIMQNKCTNYTPNDVQMANHYMNYPIQTNNYDSIQARQYGANEFMMKNLLMNVQDPTRADFAAAAATEYANARRKNATRETTNTLKAWLYEHRKNPYPTKGEKIMLAIITKMTLTQVSTWFANARRRLKKESKINYNSDGSDDETDFLNSSRVDNETENSPKNNSVKSYISESLVNDDNNKNGNESDKTQIIQPNEFNQNIMNTESTEKIVQKNKRPVGSIWSIEEITGSKLKKM
ncbi:hypothetical protein A3Q56_06652 [Intoshia linei]|uniref:Homeobox domain-containing protein n=1 Tax=Intoshia linei TaxID=1819745 RepID=A0A177AUH1_9BILA|nr:hypothetical protein A3Q56_06652 [Intoshia linei]